MSGFVACCIGSFRLACTCIALRPLRIQFPSMTRCDGLAEVGLPIVFEVTRKIVQVDLMAGVSGGKGAAESRNARARRRPF